MWEVSLFEVKTPKQETLVCERLVWDLVQGPWIKVGGIFRKGNFKSSWKQDCKQLLGKGEGKAKEFDSFRRKDHLGIIIFRRTTGEEKEV